MYSNSSTAAATLRPVRSAVVVLSSYNSPVLYGTNGLRTFLTQRSFVLQITIVKPAALQRSAATLMSIVPPPRGVTHTVAVIAARVCPERSEVVMATIIFFQTVKYWFKVNGELIYSFSLVVTFHFRRNKRLVLTVIDYTCTHYLCSIGCFIFFIFFYIYYYPTKVAHILNTHKTTVKTRTHKPIYNSG